MNLDWQRWLRSLVNGVNSTGQRVGSVALTTQSVSVAQTPIPIQQVNNNLYRISYFVRVTRAAGVSSSVDVIFRFTDGGVLCDYTASTSGNTTDSYVQGTVVISADQGSNITYEIVYTSAGVPTMQYKLNIIVEAMPS